jgi:hypothetical protein
MAWMESLVFSRADSILGMKLANQEVRETKSHFLSTRFKYSAVASETINRSARFEAKGLKAFESTSTINQTAIAIS